VARLLGQRRIAVDHRDGVGDLAVELRADRVGVVRGEELLLRDPDALDEVQRRARVALVVRGERLVEGRAQDRVDAHHARAEVPHAVEPAVVVAPRRGELAGWRPGTVTPRLTPGQKRPANVPL
jgi:hypothetical protein